MARLIDQAAYALGQAARVAWYSGYHMAALRLGRRDGGTRFNISSERTSGRDFLAAMAALFERDWANIQAGHYRAPALADSPGQLLARAREFLRDAPQVDARRRAHGHSEVLTEERRARYPRYYLQNFHYQTDGWLSEESARRYEFQVETLFAGTAAAMRRQALAPLSIALKGRDQRSLSLLDVACGTGSFLREVKENWPRLHVTALDLSPAYLSEARRALAPWSGCQFLEANAEAILAGDASQDVVTCIYLFHELPPKVRVVVAGEIARVLKPGGTFVLIDSIQPSDGRGFGSLMEFFPQAFHEPYYESYLEWDAAAAFGAHGLEHSHDTPAFLSTMRVFRKPPSRTQ